MRANLARALQVRVEQVSVKGKTNEEVDSMGRGTRWRATQSRWWHARPLTIDDDD